MEHVTFMYLVHFAECFPAHAEGYREGKHKLPLCCGSLHMCGNIFLVLRSV